VIAVRDFALKCCRARPGLLFAHVGQKTHKPSPFDGITHSPLEGRAESTPLPAEHFALAGDQLFEVAHILVIDERWTGAAVLRAEPASVFAVLTQLLPHHTRHLALAV
jgi:hypothetical protein